MKGLPSQRRKSRRFEERKYRSTLGREALSNQRWLELAALCHLIEAETRHELRIAAVDRLEFFLVVGTDLGLGDVRTASSCRQGVGSASPSHSGKAEAA